MATKSTKPKAGYLETPIRDPRRSGNRVAFVSVEKANGFAKYGPAHKYHELCTLVRETLADPHAIHSYNAEEFEGFCYIRAASYAVRNTGDRVRPPEGMIFTVFLTADLKVIEWGWEHHDRSNHLLPMVWKGRLEELIWSKEN